MDDPDAYGRLRLELAALGHELDHRLGDRDLSVGIERSLRQRGARSSRWLASPRRRAAAVLIVGVASVLAIPPARAAVTRFFRIGAITIEPSGTAPPTTGATTGGPRTSGHLDRFASLGDQQSLASVRRQMSVRVPRVGRLSTPDQVRFESSHGPHASLLYRSRPGLAEIPHSGGAGLLIEEFVGDGRTMVHKYLTNRTVAEPSDINGNPGVYLTGGPHLVFYEDALGRDIQAEGRTVGRALIFQDGDLTIRIEGNLDRDRMIDIARSL